MDFINDLETSEGLISSAWTLSVSAGSDPAPTLHLEGPSMVVIGESDNPDVKTATIQRIGGLLPDVTYVCRAEVVTTLGNTKTLWSHVRGVNVD